MYILVIVCASVHCDEIENFLLELGYNCSYHKNGYSSGFVNIHVDVYYWEDLIKLKRSLLDEGLIFNPRRIFVT